MTIFIHSISKWFIGSKNVIHDPKGTVVGVEPKKIS